MQFLGRAWLCLVVIGLGSVAGAAEEQPAPSALVLSAGPFAGVETGAVHGVYGAEAGLWYGHDNTRMTGGLDAGLTARSFYVEGQVAGATSPRGWIVGLGMGPRWSRGTQAPLGLQATVWGMLGTSEGPLPFIPYLRLEADRTQRLLGLGLMLKVPVSWQSFGHRDLDPVRPGEIAPVPVAPVRPRRVRLAVRPFLGLRGHNATVTYGADLTLDLRLGERASVGALAGLTRHTQEAGVEATYHARDRSPQVALDAAVTRRWSAANGVGLAGTLWWLARGQDLSPLFPYLRLERYPDGAVFSGGLMTRVRL